MIQVKSPDERGNYTKHAELARRSHGCFLRALCISLVEKSRSAVAPVSVSLALLFLTGIEGIAQAPYSTSAAEKERSRAQARAMFSKNFRDIQLTSQKLLKDHKSSKLTSRDLAKHTRNINKNAKTLRGLMALGDLAEKVEIDRETETPEKFNEWIQRLATLVWDFAHNPIHQNSKVFNTDLAAQAQTDLLTIIDLSKLLSDASRNYKPFNDPEN